MRLYSFIIIIAICGQAHHPHTSSEGHRVGYTAGDASGAKSETVISYFSSGVGAERTVARVVVTTRPRLPQAEVEFVVALAVAAPPRRAAASAEQLTTVAITVLVLAVAVVHCPHLERIGGKELVKLQVVGKNYD